jgi:hypothetical protein
MWDLRVIPTGWKMKMSARNPAHRRSLIKLTPDSPYVEIGHLLWLFAASIRRTQTNLDKKQVYLAQSFLSSIRLKPLIKQLLGLISFRRYKISELLVEFAIIEENKASSPGAPIFFRLIQSPLNETSARHASIKVIVNIQICAEFRIDDEITASIVISNKYNMCSGLQEKE